jgi:hypothetical protein
MSTITRGFSLFADRYGHDARRTYAAGWAQVDTYQDASYFGIWTNPTTREIFTYCEGDETLETCSDDEDYARALREMLDCYHSPGSSIPRPMIDAKTNPAMVERFTALGFADRVH